MSRNRYSPSSLTVAQRHCPRALTYHQQRAVVVRDQFGVGDASHHILHMLGKLARETNAPVKAPYFIAESDYLATIDAACEQLRISGMPGKREGPLHPDQVSQARAIVEAWVESCHVEFSPTEEYEIAGAFRANYSTAHWDASDVVFRLIFDVVGVSDEYLDADDPEPTTVLHIRDYKTAFPTKEDELDTIQMKAQLVYAYHLFAKPDPTITMIQQEVVNLRTHATYYRDLYLDLEGIETIKHYQKEIEMYRHTYDSMPGDRPAQVGYGCASCPYFMRCKEAQAAFGDASIPSTALARAQAYASAQARINALRPFLREDARENPIVLEDGSVYGFHVTTENTPTAEAADILFGLFADQAGTDALNFLAYMGGLSVKQVKKIVKSLYPRKMAAQEEVFDHTLAKKAVTKLMLKKGDADEEEEEA